MKLLVDKLLAHPRSINETYLQHFRFTLEKSFFLLKTTVALLTHGILPCFFETYTRDNILKFSDTLVKRNPPGKLETICFDSLSHKLAERDVISKIGKDKFDEINVREKEALIKKEQSRYLQEFHQTGIEKLNLS